MAQFKQDMPPPGGYEPITWSRIPLKPGWSHTTRYALLFGVCTASFLVYKNTIDQINLEKIEMRCARIALQPMILAERDRMLLKQLKRNRDYEENLMKNVPGWEVGKWNHYPVFLTLGPDEFFMPSKVEYYAHADPKMRSLLNQHCAH